MGPGRISPLRGRCHTARPNVVVTIRTLCALYRCTTASVTSPALARVMFQTSAIITVINTCTTADTSENQLEKYTMTGQRDGRSHWLSLGRVPSSSAFSDPWWPGGWHR